MVLKKYNLDELHTFKSLRNYLPVKKHINNILCFAVASPGEIKPMSYLPFDLTCNIPPPHQEELMKWVHFAEVFIFQQSFRSYCVF